jgi:hypothetical protein
MITTAHYSGDAPCLSLRPFNLLTASISAKGAALMVSWWLASPGNQEHEVRPPGPHGL